MKKWAQDTRNLITKKKLLEAINMLHTLPEVRSVPDRINMLVDSKKKYKDLILQKKFGAIGNYEYLKRQNSLQKVLLNLIYQIEDSEALGDGFCEPSDSHGIDELKSLKEHWNLQIAQANTGLVLKELIEYTNRVGHSEYNCAINLSARFKGLKKAIRMGTTSKANIDLEKNCIHRDLIDTIAEL